MFDHPLIKEIENAKHLLANVEFWSASDLAKIMGLDKEEYDEVMFKAMSNCAFEGINYTEHFCETQTDVLMSSYGLYRFLKNIKIQATTPEEFEIIKGPMAAREYFAEVPNIRTKFKARDENANDRFLYSGDKVRILHEIGQRRGLAGAAGIVQFQTYNTLSIIGPFQFFCNREDVELIERKIPR